MTLPKSYVQFAIYETFAPTTLRGKAVLIAADDATWAGGLPAVIAMECARIGAHLALAGQEPVHAPVSRDIVAYGRPVLELSGPGGIGARGVAEAVERYDRLDLLVTVGETWYPELADAAATAMAAHGGGCIVHLSPPEAEAGMEQHVHSLRERFNFDRMRVNGILAPLPAGEAAGPQAQELAWLAVFLASAAGAALSGHCLHPVLTAAAD